MVSRSKMDVNDWQDSPLPIIPKAKARRRFLPPTIIGVIGTVLLHSMIIQSVTFGARGPKQRPPETQESANSLAKSTDAADSLVLITLATIANANSAATPSLVSSLPDLLLAGFSPAHFM